MTLSNRRITLKGIKPRQLEKWESKYFWLYGLIEPISGQHFFYEFSNRDTGCFEKYLELFSQNYPDDLHVIQLDNSPAHPSLTLSIPERIILYEIRKSLLQLSRQQKRRSLATQPLTNGVKINEKIPQ